MKKIILNFIVLLFFTITYSQSTVYNTLLGDQQEGAYYKDAANELNKFEGTWLYTNGNTSFKLVLQKRVMQKFGKYYCDLLVGGYQYIENGIVKVDWLNDINIVYPDIRHHKVEGNYFLPDNLYPPICTTCLPNERRLSVSMSEPHATGRSYAFRFKTNVGAPDQIIIQPMGRDIMTYSTGDPVPYYSLPLILDYTLTKQP